MRPIRYGASDCKWYQDDCHSVRQANPRLLGKEWAALENVNIDELGINTVADFLDVQDRLLNQTGAHLHLHDATMAHYCPWALQLRAPKYFPYDLRYIGDLGDQPIKHETERAKGRAAGGVKVQLPASRSFVAGHKLPPHERPTNAHDNTHHACVHDRPTHTL